MDKNMIDVREAVLVLCDYLKYLLGIDVDPENIRLAKFNKQNENTVKQLWQLLFKLCCELDSDGKSNEDVMVEFVKYQLFIRQYCSKEFYCLSSDMIVGSRELLLALGWLIATFNILENIVKQKVLESPINKELGTSKLEQVQDHLREKNLTQTSENYTNYILWTAGRIHQNLKAIKELDQQRVKLISQVHNSTSNLSGVPHLSVMETKLILYPESHKDIIKKVTEINEMLEIRNRWLTLSDRFWNWMGSVAFEKKKDSTIHVNLNEKYELMKFLKLMRIKLKTNISFINIRTETDSDTIKLKKLSEGVSSISLDSSKSEHSSVTRTGLPKFFLQPQQDSDIEKFMANANELLKKLEEDCEYNKVTLNCELYKCLKSCHCVCVRKA